MSAPVLRPIGDRRWETVGTWRGYGVTIPCGFRTDLASIPPVAELLLRMHRNELHYVVAGLVHDFHYNRQDITRREADRHFRAIARAEGAPRWQTALVYAAVRLFGWPSWRRSSQRSR